MPPARTVSLTVPAHPDYLVLARLALAAVCRLTTLDDEDVADLKLAVTEAAAGVGEQPPDAPAADVGFEFRLGDDRLELAVRGAVRPDASDEDRALGRAIVEATVDELSLEDDGRVLLVKRLRPAGG